MSEEKDAARTGWPETGNQRPRRPLRRKRPAPSSVDLADDIRDRRHGLRASLVSACARPERWPPPSRDLPHGAETAIRISRCQSSNRTLQPREDGGSAVGRTVVHDDYLNSLQKLRFPEQNQTAQARFDQVLLVIYGTTTASVVPLLIWSLRGPLVGLYKLRLLAIVGDHAVDDFAQGRPGAESGQCRELCDGRETAHHVFKTRLVGLFVGHVYNRGTAVGGFLYGVRQTLDRDFFPFRY